ncbi:hypothetical protein V5799_018226 [Amblyomma americanum]|uniref:Uncharacterized protein n=1 Tax=Amblyomma americanum TaxID=6943 RepID=A0AAQ4EZU8_AMBAM
MPGTAAEPFLLEGGGTHELTKAPVRAAALLCWKLPLWALLRTHRYTSADSGGNGAAVPAPSGLDVIGQAEAVADLSVVLVHAGA